MRRTKNTQEEEIQQIKQAYKNFLNQIRKIGVERDKKIMAIIKRIEKGQINKIRASLK